LEKPTIHGEKSLFLYHDDLAVPDITENQVLVRVHACGLNPVDLKLGYFCKEFPRVTGLDVAGVVEKVGANAKGWKIGERVTYYADVGSNKNGGLAEFATVDSKLLLRLPDGVSFEEAAAVPTAGWTAWIALVRKCRIAERKGDVVMITAGAGGVGGFAIQLAKLHGLTVITTTSSKNVEYVKKLGADHIIDYSKEDIAARVKELTHGRGVDIWLDVLGTTSADIGVRSLAANGDIAVAAGSPSPTVLGELIFKQGSLHGLMTAAGMTNDEKSQKNLVHVGNEMLALIQNKKLNPLISEAISLSEAVPALQRIGEGHVVGKIVVKM